MTDQAYSVTAEELKSFVERIEALEAEKRDIADQVKEVYAELKGRGYSAPVTREIVKLRRMRPDDRAEKEAILEVYTSALGM